MLTIFLANTRVCLLKVAANASIMAPAPNPWETNLYLSGVNNTPFRPIVPRIKLHGFYFLRHAWSNALLCSSIGVIRLPSPPTGGCRVGDGRLKIGENITTHKECGAMAWRVISLAERPITSQLSEILITSQNIQFPISVK